MDPFQTIQSDIDGVRKRVKTMPFDNATRAFFTDELLPLLSTVVETTSGEFSQMAEALDALLDQSETVLLPDFAARLKEALAVGVVLCQLVQGGGGALGAPPEQVEAIAKTIAAYQKAVEILVPEIDELTLEDLDDGDRDDGDRDGGDGNPDEEEREEGEGVGDGDFDEDGADILD